MEISIKSLMLIISFLLAASAYAEGDAAAGKTKPARSGQTILAVHDLGQKISLDTVQSAVNRHIRITLCSYDPIVFYSDQHTAARSTKTAGRLIPADLFITVCGRCCLYNREGKTSSRSGYCYGIGFYKITT